MGNIMEKLELTAQSMYCKSQATGKQAILNMTANAELTISLQNSSWAE